MNHKPYSDWIFEETQLSEEQEIALQAHMLNCQECRNLQQAWQTSKKIIMESPLHSPAAGFVKRWNANVRRNKQRERVVRTRVSIIGTSLLVFANLVAYIITSGSFTRWLASIFNLFTKIIFSFANGLAGFEQILMRMPTSIPITGGIFILGILSAVFFFLLLAVFQYLRKERLLNETIVE